MEKRFEDVEFNLSNQEEGKPEEVLKIIKNDPSVAKAQDMKGETILFKALKFQASELIIYTLLKNGADPCLPSHVQEIVPLWHACNSGYSDRVILSLIAFGGNVHLGQKNAVSLCLYSKSC